MLPILISILFLSIKSIHPMLDTPPLELTFKSPIISEDEKNYVNKIMGIWKNAAIFLNTQTPSAFLSALIHISSVEALLTDQTTLAYWYTVNNHHYLTKAVYQSPYTTLLSVTVTLYPKLLTLWLFTHNQPVPLSKDFNQALLKISSPKSISYQENVIHFLDICKNESPELVSICRALFLLHINPPNH